MPASIGIDVAKHELVAHAHPRAERAVFANDAAGQRALVAWAQARQPERIVLESTSTYHVAAALALAAAELPVVVVNPAQIRAFSRGLGRLAKTDRLDAELIARFAALAAPPVRAPLSPTAQRLKALFTRRAQLQAVVTAQGNQRESAPAEMQPFIDPLIAEARRVLAQVEQELTACLERDPVWAANARLLRTIPGVGPKTAAALLAGVPELGAIGHAQLAALVGVAPQTRQSGPLRPTAAIAGGRTMVRAALYMPTLAAIRCNPVLQALYQRLLANHKPPLVAIVACMHKLLTLANAMLRDQTAWRPATQP
jgi:transposase